jgi:hypothetical protein
MMPENNSPREAIDGGSPSCSWRIDRAGGDRGFLLTAHPRKAIPTG